MSSSVGYVRQAWYKWKALRLPWRKQFLVGFDLSGNTFWEFKDALNANRFRRIVRYRTTTHYADIKISPQWHQWLRHTREAAPTVEEQQYDISRQAMLKQLAAQADARWNSVPSYLDSPAQQQPAPAMATSDPDHLAAHGDASNSQSSTASDISRTGQVPETSKPAAKERKENPFHRPQTGAPSENWQPQAWSPGNIQKRN